MIRDLSSVFNADARTGHSAEVDWGVEASHGNLATVSVVATSL